MCHQNTVSSMFMCVKEESLQSDDDEHLTTTAHSVFDKLSFYTMHLKDARTPLTYNYCYFR